MSKAQEVGKRIAQARREKAVRDEEDVRPADVARALKVSGATVSDWESGKITPREEVLGRLAAYLGVTPAFLRYGIPGGRETEPPLTTKEITDFVNEELAASRAYDAERAAMPRGVSAPGAARKAAGGTKGKSRGR